jgi:hypothetical protein
VPLSKKAKTPFTIHPPARATARRTNAEAKHPAILTPPLRTKLSLADAGGDPQKTFILFHMKPTRIPKFIRERYNPTAREWLRWLRFRKKVISLANQDFCALYVYFKACAKNRRTPKGGCIRSGMYPGSGSSSRELEMFPWAWFTYSVCFQGESIMLTCDSHNYDIPTLAYANNF